MGAFSSKRVGICPVKLLQGDCLDLMKEIPDKSIDLILCDLPYGTTDCKWDTIIPFADLWAQYSRVAKTNAAVVLFAAQPFTTKLIDSNFKEYRYNWYWKKNNVTGGIFCKVQPMRCIEDICVFYKKMPTYNPQGIRKLKEIKINEPINKNVYTGKKNPSIQTHTGYPKHILEFKNEALFGERYHPTQKPVALLEYLVKTYTNEGDTVLDNCMGSGSTGVACVNTGRHFIGMEIENKYYEIAKMRINNNVSSLH